VSESQVPDFVRDDVIADVADEFFRYAAVINDPNTPVTGLEVITNERKAVALFQDLLNRYNIPGRVVVLN
jgi:hypothetical protein